MVDSGSDAGGDGAEECGDWLSYMVYDFIVLSTCQWLHMALAIKRPDILLM